jgi:hypothetical protein
MCAWSRSIEMKKKFPQYIHQPFQVLWFETDDMVIFFLSIIVAQATGGFFWLLPLISPLVTTKIKLNYPRGFSRHMFYYLGLMNFKGYPHFFQKKFQE